MVSMEKLHEVTLHIQSPKELKIMNDMELNYKALVMIFIGSFLIFGAVLL